MALRGDVGVLFEDEHHDEWCRAILTMPRDWIETLLGMMNPLQKLRICVIDSSIHTTGLPSFEMFIENIQVKIGSASCEIIIKVADFVGSLKLSYAPERIRAALQCIAASLRRFCMHAELFAFAIEITEPIEHYEEILDLAYSQDGIGPERLLIRGLPLPVVNINSLSAIERAVVTCKCPSFTATALHNLREGVKNREGKLVSLEATVTRAVAFEFLRATMNITRVDLPRRNPRVNPTCIFNWDRSEDHDCEVFVGSAPSANVPIFDVLHFTLGVFSSIHYLDQNSYKVHFETWDGADISYITRDFVPLVSGVPYNVNP